MYLQKLEIQGFKSFANRNILTFPGMLDKSRRGITAVVGPNGSGKSNVADAVRWALGEQSMKTLRGKKSEDVIFSGTERKGKLGMSEVSMHLNNEDKQAPVDYSEIVITRRLYRSGESEYLLNSNRVRLSDIQMLLAKSKFGQKTYSVIGQGMVEGFLNTSLAERKEFFDEATGVKQYQIKRDDSLNKLRSSYENLIQAQMLINEIEPRIKSLTRQVNRLKRRGEIEGELRNIQLKYYRRQWHEINGEFSRYNSEFLELEKTKFLKEKKLEQLNRDLGKLEQAGEGAGEFARLQEELAAVQAEKEGLTAQLAKMEAQAEMKLEQSGKFDVSYLVNKRNNLDQERTTIAEELSTQEVRIEDCRKEDAELKGKFKVIDNELRDLNERLTQAGEDATDTRHLHKRLKEVVSRLEAVHGHDDIGKVKEVIREIEHDLRELITIAEESGGPVGVGTVEWQELHGSMKRLAEDKDNLLIQINENSLRITARSERVKLLTEKSEGLKNEIALIERKLSQQSGGFDLAAMTAEQEDVKSKLAAVHEKIRNTKNRIDESAAKDEEARARLFSLQKELSALQQELNMVNNKLNDLKINSTRFETKLEDLEVEIRQELGSLKEVREKGEGEEIDTAAIRGEIGNLKHQLELIGGIDPQIENEYNETKDRYDFLTGQVDDFTKTVDSLQKVIKELDLMIKDQFDKEFKAIAANFEKYFKILFNGGAARIIKVMDALGEDGEEAAENGETENKKKEDQPNLNDLKKIKFLQKHNATGLAGIEIQATPPGKKIKSITMLSGGERALTAIALICAIISSNPSPFVVLDEVDAALDEANSERLAKILDELSHKTQFIVITHNRASMRRANILYGVTMGDDGVSKLLSVKLEEAAVNSR